MTSTPSPQSSPTVDSKWWEVYIIRYFVGSVVGAAILLYLNGSASSKLNGVFMPGITDMKQITMELLILLATMGLTFCYISSGPVLAIHAARATLIEPGPKSRNNKLLGGLGLLTLIAGALAHFKWDCDLIQVLSIAALSLTALCQLIPLSIATWDRAKVSNDYYAKICKARADARGYKLEYKQSYRHLREHGNAFLILLFEFVLGVVLAGAENPAIAGMYLIVWILPAALVWFHGTYLESRYAELP